MDDKKLNDEIDKALDWFTEGAKKANIAGTIKYQDIVIFMDEAKAEAHTAIKDLVVKSKIDTYNKAKNYFVGFNTNVIDWVNDDIAKLQSSLLKEQTK